MYKLILLICFFGIICTQFVTETYADTTIPETEFGDISLYNYLIINHDVNGNGTLELEEAESVTEMYISDDIVVQNIAGIKYLKNLEKLEINYQYGLRDLSEIAQLSKLTWLDIVDNRLQDLPDLSNLNNLTTLFINKNYLTYDDIQGKLPQLIISQSNWEEKIGFNDQLKEKTSPIVSSTCDVEWSLTLDYEYGVNLYINHKIDAATEKELELVELPDVEYDRIYIYEIKIENAETGEEIKGPISQQAISLGGYTPVGDEKYYYYQLSEDNVLRSVDGYYENAGNERVGFNITIDSYDKIVVLIDQKDYSAEVSDEEVQANVEGVFEEDIYVKVEKISDMRPYQEEIDQLYKRVKNLYDLKLYDITVYGKNTDELEQPIGTALVSIKMDYNPDYEYTVFRLQNTVWIKLDSYYKNGYLYFETDHFSIFSIVLSEILDKDELEEEQESDNSSNNKREELISDKVKLYVQIGIVAVVVIVIIIIELMRRKGNKNCSGR